MLMFRKKASPIARVAFNMKPAKGPWGGSSPFVTQLSSYLSAKGYDVRYDLRRPVDVVVLIDPRTDGKKTFGLEEIASYKNGYPDTKVLHRINECDQRKNTDFMDKLLEEANDLADYTIFISEWLKDYHALRWYDVSKRHGVIYNGADPRIFHPINGNIYDKSSTFRLVTHHWSDNPLKGFDIYRQVDELVADGALKGVELWVIGRWPKGMKWRSARTCAPAIGLELAEKLRLCHAYLTASLWEPCGMHHVEGAQCGLPLIYHEDGGGIVEAGQKYGIGYRADVKSAIIAMKDGYHKYRKKLLRDMPSGDMMCLRYGEVIQRLMCEKNV